MKKIFFLFLIFGAAVFSVAGEDLDETNLLFQGESTSALYPEFDYIDNPSILMGITSDMILGNLDTDFNLSGTGDERSDDSIGADGGTETYSSYEILPYADFTILKKNEDKPGVFGLDLSYNSEHRGEKTESINYNSSTEDVIDKYNENNYSGSADIYFGFLSREDGEGGLSFGYGLTYDPKFYNWVTDSSYSPAFAYTQLLSGQDNTDEYMHTYSSTLGFNMPLEKNRLYFSLLYSGYYDDLNREYKAVDTDADGYLDTIYTLEDYYLLPAADGGPEYYNEASELYQLSSYEHQEYAVNNNVDVKAAIVMPLSKTFSFIAEAGYTPLDYTYYYYLEHELAESETDDSYSEYIYDAGLSSFDAMLALEFINQEKKSRFRIGLGYSLFAERYSQNADTAAGVSAYNSLNTNHYTELSLGTDPADDSLSADNDLYPSETYIHSADLLARYTVNPGKDFRFFFDASVSALYSVEVYRAYNTDTRSVWEEKNASGDLTWEIGTKAGVILPMGEKLNFVIDMQNFSTIGNAVITGETRPWDIDLGRETDDSGDLSDSSGIDFQVNAAFVIRL